MLKYIVGYYSSNNKKLTTLKSFDNYDKAFLYYCDKIKEDFLKIGAIPTYLKIAYVLDGKFIGTERFEFVQEDTE